MQALAVGDQVFGVAPGCLGRSVIVTEKLVVPKPLNISFEDAATTPTVYVTVFQAFGDLAASSNTKVGGIPPLSLLSALSPWKFFKNCQQHVWCERVKGCQQGSQGDDSQEIASNKKSLPPFTQFLDSTIFCPVQQLWLHRNARA